MKKYIIFFLFFASACQTSQKKKFDGSIKWKIPIEEAVSTEVKMFDLLDDAFFIPLETKEDNLLGEIKKVKFTEDKIYLNSGNSVLACYDMDGNHVFDIDRQGRGPGEYQQIDDFVVDDSIYLYDRSRKRVLVFDKPTQEYQRAIKVPFLAEEMSKNADNLVFHTAQGFNEPKFNYEIITLSLSDKKFHKHLQYPDREYVGDTPHYLTTYGDTVLYSSKIRNTVYRIEAEKVKPYGYANIVDKLEGTIAGEVLPYSSWESQEFRSLSNWYETPNYIFFKYRSDEIHEIFYDKSSHQTVDIGQLKIDVPLVQMQAPIGTYKDYFIVESSNRFFYEPDKEALKNPVVSKLYKATKNVKETDNAGLYFYKFK